MEISLSKQAIAFSSSLKSIKGGKSTKMKFYEGGDVVGLVAGKWWRKVRMNFVGRPCRQLGRACAGYPNISPSSVNVYTLQLLISPAGGNHFKVSLDQVRYKSQNKPMYAWKWRNILKHWGFYYTKSWQNLRLWLWSKKVWIQTSKIKEKLFKIFAECTLKD